MIKTALFDIDENEKKFFTEKLKGKCELLFFENPITNVNPLLLKESEIFSGFIYSKFPKEVLEKFPKLKFIATQSTGYDHIDIEYCKIKKILVSNVPEYGSSTVAEHTFALILTLLKRIPESIDRVKNGNFDPEGLTGLDLKGKTIGVIGTGKIGLNVIKIAKGFGMNVISYDPFPKIEMEKYLGFKYTDLHKLLESSDIITFHCPLSEDTRHLINSNNINKLKDGCYIINTARGGLIETQSLFNALQSKKVAGAGLDVLEEENSLKEERELLCKGSTCKANLTTLIQNHILTNLPNVVITPHDAFNSKEALQRILETTADNITSFLDNKPINLVK